MIIFWASVSLHTIQHFGEASSEALGSGNSQKWKEVSVYATAFAISVLWKPYHDLMSNRIVGWKNISECLQLGIGTLFYIRSNYCWNRMIWLVHLLGFGDWMYVTCLDGPCTNIGSHDGVLEGHQQKNTYSLKLISVLYTSAKYIRIRNRQMCSYPRTVHTGGGYWTSPFNVGGAGNSLFAISNQLPQMDKADDTESSLISTSPVLLLILSDVMLHWIRWNNTNLGVGFICLLYVISIKQIAK